MSTLQQNILSARSCLVRSALFQEIQIKTTSPLEIGEGLAFKELKEHNELFLSTWQIVLPDDTAIYYTDPEINDVLQRLNHNDIVIFSGISMPDEHIPQNKTRSTFYAVQVSIEQE